MAAKGHPVCPVELAGSLDNRIRRWLQDPRKILAPFVREGMTVLDVGCGPGVFTVEIAKMVGEGGRVFAADLQEGMLDKLRNKIKGTDLERRITLVKCDADRINVSETVDFILAFYMVHEVPDKESFFRQIRGILKEDGEALIVDPRPFTVSRKDFELTKSQAEANGFRVGQGPKVRFSWSAVLRLA